MRYHLLTAAILAGALALYVVGMSGGGSLLLLVGAALEVSFWVRAMRGSRVISVAPTAKP
jgi:hypothetical protein